MKNFIIALAFMLFSTVALAEDSVDNNFIEVGADFMHYDESMLPSDGVALTARWGTLGDTGAYLWGSYEKPEMQSLWGWDADVETFGLGAGLRMPMNEKFYGFAELGMYFPDVDSKTFTGLDYDNSWGGSLGMGYDVTKNVTVNAKYRFLELDTKSTLVGDLDMSALMVGVSYRF